MHGLLPTYSPQIKLKEDASTLKFSHENKNNKIIKALMRNSKIACRNEKTTSKSRIITSKSRK